MKGIFLIHFKLYVSLKLFQIMNSKSSLGENILVSPKFQNSLSDIGFSILEKRFFLFNIRRVSKNALNFYQPAKNVSDITYIHKAV